MLVASAFYDEHKHTWPDPDSNPKHTAMAHAIRDRLIAGGGGSGSGLPKSFIADDTLQSVIRVADCQLNTVCAVFGALIGQEVLKVLSGRDAPIKNICVYDSQSGLAIVREVV